MIYIVSALYQEAKPVIRQLHLKKQKIPAGFDIYENEEQGIRLIISGVGALAAATAVGSFLSFYCVQSSDVLVNWGMCAAEPSACTEDLTGKVFVCNQLIDRIYHRTYYPDMIVRTDLPETYLYTESKAWDSGNVADDRLYSPQKSEEKVRIALHDMEATAVYYAGSFFLSPHQMHFVKVVSDYGSRCFSKERAVEAIKEGIPHFFRYLDQLQRCVDILRESTQEKNFIEKEEEELMDEFCCSAAMRDSFLQCMRYWKLAGINYQLEIQHMRERGELPCTDRREGKEKLEYLKSRLL